MTNTHWPTFPRWLLNEHLPELEFASLLSTGRAAEVTARLQREPAMFAVLLKLLGDTETALSVRIGIGVVMEDLGGSTLLRQNLAALGKLCTHSDARIRTDACHYLGLSNDPQVIPWLQACANDPVTEVRETAQDALERLQA